MTTLHRSTASMCGAATLVALAALASTACQRDRDYSTANSDENYSENRADSSTRSNGNRNYSQARSGVAAGGDGEFASRMAMHSKSAIDMGRIQANNGSRTDVRALAARIVDTQTAENTKLLAIARETGQPDTRQDSMMDKHSAECTTQLNAARGTEVDRLFLTHMIDHHERGVKMTEAAMPNLRRDDLQRMARTMIVDQNREVAQMRDMLNQL